MTSNKLREYIMQYTVSSMIGRPSFESHYGMVKNKQYQIKLHHLNIKRPYHFYFIYGILLCNDDKIQQYLSFLLGEDITRS